MSSAVLLQRFEDEVELRSLSGFANVQVIHPKAQPNASSEKTPMTEADWDKFEADINEAFERLP